MNLLTVVCKGRREKASNNLGWMPTEDIELI